MTTPSEHHKQHKLRNYFFSGVLFLIPIGITSWVLQFLVKKAEGYARPFVVGVLDIISPGEGHQAPEIAITGVSLILVVSGITMVGFLANVYAGKKFLNVIDAFMLRLPFVRNIYGGAKQIIEAFTAQRSGSFKKVVLLEFPRKEAWVLGFVTQQNLDESKKIFGKRLVGVFVPSTPNPTTGFLLYLNPFDIIVLDLEVEEAVKLIVSAGMVTPPNPVDPPHTLGDEMNLDPETLLPNADAQKPAEH